MIPAASLASHSAEKFALFCAHVARVERGLGPLAAAPALVTSGGNGADGGYLVPPDFREELVTTLLGEDSLLRYCFLISTPSNSASFPVDAAPPWTATGVNAQWDGEGTVNPPSEHQVKPALAAASVKLAKQTVLVPMTSELYEDAPSAGVYLSTVVRDRMLYKMNDAILNGDGIGKPAGILKSDALITQTKEGAQPAATVTAANTRAMWRRLYAPSKRRAVWIANPDVEEQLQAFGFPAYVPAGVAGNALPLLQGRPVVYTEAAPALGQKGDIVLADLGSYSAAVKVRRVVNGASAESLFKSEVSMHVWFDNDLVALRFTMRAAGRPIWVAPIQRTKGQATVSTFVTLEAR